MRSLFILLFLSTVCGAAEQPKFVVKVTTSYPKNQTQEWQDVGTGFLVHSDPAKGDYVLTCWHNLREGVNDKNHRIEVDLVNGKKTKATIKAKKPSKDLALLSIKHVDLGYAEPSSEPVKKGSYGKICGFPSAGGYKEFSGFVGGRLKFQGGVDGELFLLEGPNMEHGKIQGISGGPVLNRNGHVIGLLFGADGDRAANCVSLETIMDFLSEVKEQE